MDVRFGGLEEGKPFRRIPTHAKVVWVSKPHLQQPFWDQVRGSRRRRS